MWGDFFFLEAVSRRLKLDLTAGSYQLLIRLMSQGYHSHVSSANP